MGSQKQDEGNEQPVEREEAEETVKKHQKGNRQGL